jgi:hypothetical protein
MAIFMFDRAEAGRAYAMNGLAGNMQRFFAVVSRTKLSWSGAVQAALDCQM